MSTEKFDLIPHCVINPLSICVYNEIVYNQPHVRRSSKFVDCSAPEEGNDKFINSTRKNDGSLSDNAKRKLQKAIEYLITTAYTKKTKSSKTGKIITFKTAFITLTLPAKQRHLDSDIINKCLNQFLIELVKYHNLKNYVWRSERQKNGNIHFHILIDKFISWENMRGRWNRIVGKLGYIDDFELLHNHRNPNSTDIHSTRQIKNLKAYLCKYMTKSEQSSYNLPTDDPSKKWVSGRIWACNHELSSARGLNLIIDNEVDAELRKIEKSVKVRKYSGDYFTVYYLDYHVMLETGAEKLFKFFSEYLFEKFKFSEQLTFE